MADRLEIMLELERRGKLPPEKLEVLGELRKRGKIPQLEGKDAEASPEVPEWGAKNPTLYGIAGAARETLGPVAEAVGLAGGAALGLGSGGPGGAVVGAGLGYGGVKQGLSSVDAMLGNKPNTTPSQAAKDVVEGASMEALGPVVAKTGGAALGLAGKGVKQLIGATTGSGPGAVDEALKGGKSFTDAMRGKVSGEDIVDNVRSSLNTLKEQRGEAYREQLAKITEKKAPIDISPLKEKVLKWLKTYKVDFKGEGGLDFSNSKLPKEAAAKVEEVFNDVLRWDGTPGNNTAVGLDTLKQRIGNYYSESSAARAVISDMEKATKKLITDNVPEYAQMTKGYSEATTLIKDIESGLMLRKQGMTGRVTGDMTLRRLTSAMRENNELRKDLLNVLGKESGEDLSGQVGGYAMADLIPKGLVGKLSAGSLGTLVYLNPKFWPVLAASSPRVAGEFLNAYGKAMKYPKTAIAKAGLEGSSPEAYKAIALGANQ